MASPAITLNPIVIIAMLTMQNQSSSSNTSALEIAARTHTTLFKWYLVWIVSAALVSAIFTWAVWRSGNRQQDAAIAETNERTAKLGTELTEAKTRQVEAETKLEAVRKRQGPRQFDIHAFSKALKGKPRCPIEIVCQPNDIEAYNLAELILLMLTADWIIDPLLVVPIPADMGTQVPIILGGDGLPIDLGSRGRDIFLQSLRSLPPTVRAGAPGGNVLPPSGIYIASNKNISPPLDINTPYGALVNAFTEVGLEPGPGLADLPDNKLRIIVGSKP